MESTRIAQIAWQREMGQSLPKKRGKGLNTELAAPPWDASRPLVAERADMHE